jgi:hypothetical protein
MPTPTEKVMADALAAIQKRQRENELLALRASARAAAHWTLVTGWGSSHR